jgi:predicted lipoprotein with Yx(FWY)xxD motif
MVKGLNVAMKILRLGLSLTLSSLLICAAHAADNRTGEKNSSAEYPAQVAIGQSKRGQIFVDGRGKALYVLNKRTAFGRSGSDILYCATSCGQKWSPLAAPADAKPIGQWKVVKGISGPQWTYKEDLVFTFNDDTVDTLGGDGYDDIFKAIAFIPSAPKLTAPANVKPLFSDGAYVLADMQGHALYVRNKQRCDANCEQAQPFAAGLANRDIGAWTVSRQGEYARWAYRGQPVYINVNDASGRAPAYGIALRP